VDATCLEFGLLGGLETLDGHSENIRQKLIDLAAAIDEDDLDELTRGRCVLLGRVLPRYQLTKMRLDKKRKRT